MRKIISIFIVLMIPFLCCYSVYSPVELGYEEGHIEIEILTLKCNQKSLGYILEALETHGFRVVSLFYDGMDHALWTVNYYKIIQRE